MKNDVCKVVHIDDHPIFREGIQYVIRKMPGYQLVGSADNGKAFIQMINQFKPDIALIDIDLSGTTWNGLRLAEEVYKKQCNTKLVLLSNYITQHHFDVAYALGVQGFLFKNVDNQEIEECLHKVRLGQRFLSKLCFEFLDTYNILEDKDNSGSTSHENLDHFNFTNTETKIVSLIAEGLTSAEIAHLLKKSTRTIDNHRYRICKKLNLSGSNSLLKFILDNKRYFLDKIKKEETTE